MLIKAPYDSGSIMIQANEITVQNGVAHVPEKFLLKVLQLDGYRLKVKEELPLKKAKKVLLIRHGGLGDVLLTTPVVRIIRKLNKKAKICFLTSPENKMLLEGNSNIDEIIDDKKPHKLKFLNKFQHVVHWNRTEFDINSKVSHRVDVFADKVAGHKLSPLTDKSLDYFIKKEEIKWARKFLKGCKRPFVVFVVNTYSGNRHYGIGRILELAEGVNEKFGGTQIIVDKKGYKGARKGLLNLTGKLSIREVGAVLNESDLVVTPDTGLYHLASALKKKIVSYFGAMDYNLRQTYDDVAHIVNNIDCYPCNEYGCTTPTCIKGIKNKHIFKCIRKMLDVG